jgi:4-diphosphocytidyl-2-C-methyl-D-erythritol kinase
MHPHRLRVLCPAKLNIGLEVLARRGDGFHDICTVLQAIDFYDSLELEVVDGDGSEVPQLTVDGPFACEVPDEGNLVLAAWAALSAGICLPSLQVRLTKNVPAGSGLGGGSSDAAGMLLALRELARMAGFDPDGGSVQWPPSTETGLSHEARLAHAATLAGLTTTRLEAAALRLGSDVPFFISGCCQLAAGRGEQLEPLARTLDFAAVVAVPSFGALSGPAYGALGRTDRPLAPLCVPRVAEGLARADWSAVSGALVNDFAHYLNMKHREYAAWDAALTAAGAQAVSISGSGSALFGLFESRAAAERALAALQAVGGLRYAGVHLPLS